MRTETQSSQLGLRQRNGGGEVVDFGAMVEAFGRIRSRLIEIAGHQKAGDEYYGLLEVFHCGHANRFKSAAEDVTPESSLFDEPSANDQTE